MIDPRSGFASTISCEIRGSARPTASASMTQAREEIELFHAYCDAGLWNEADSVYVALDNPKHRFLAPAVERDLLLRFFPEGDWRRPPLWPGPGFAGARHGQRTSCKSGTPPRPPGRGAH